MRAGLVLVVAAVIGCAPGAPSTASGGARDEAKAAAPAAPEVAVTPPVSGPPELVPAPIEGAIAPIVVEALERARVDRRTLVVTVGARWCEPCVRFHDAVARGELDARLPGVRFLEFDLDRDGARLREAGYDSRYIPLFVIPEADGRGGTRRVEGGIKGDLAVDHILGRLGPLLAGAGA